MKKNIRFADLCPCTSGRPYEFCCLPLHEGQTPKDALALMRSRYSAYVIGYSDYIIQTTHPYNPSYQSDCNHWKREILEFSNQTQFEGLEIISFIHGKEIAFVTFIAKLKYQQKDATFKEKSRFEKMNGHWLYHSAQIG